ncbi:MAG: glycosyltransferase family 4 protein [Bacteroidales bacterium]|nr:glycosyltransferase family 4 protein [Bacteroidales bacterium]MBN2817828.1 glycosyltransferase family 4 protein [Bacteroidales bacterium]
MRNTGNLITVSDYMKRKASFVLKRNDIERIYNALSFKGEEKISEKKMCFLTVGHIYNFDRFYIKGINEFINLAKQLPEFEFLLIGGEYKKIEEWFGNKLPENVVVLQKQKHDKLENYYQGAMFYCQFSRAESFSLSTVEAMYFGCIPILSKKGALPEIGKEFALYSTGNIKETAEKVRQLAKVKDRGLSKHMRKYIIDNFYIENRTEKLLSFLKMRMG